jgi:hypothetical protein
MAAASLSPSPDSAGAIVAGPVLTGSLGAAARRHGNSLARAWMDVRAVLVCDTSGSMASQDAGPANASGEHRHQRSRWDACGEELAILQARSPGRTAVVAFNTTPSLALGGRLPPPQGDTNLAGALDYAHSLLEPDAQGITVAILSDGEPNDETTALASGRRLIRLGAKLETVYVGPEHDTGGRAFLARLAGLGGATPRTAYRGGAGGVLADTLTPLLTDAATGSAR